MTYPNIQELLALAAGIRAGSPVNAMDQLPVGAIPMQENTDPLEMRFDNSDPGRYTPSMLDPEGKYIRDALEITPGTNITPIQVQNPNAPQPPATMEKRPGIPVFTTPYQHEGQYTPTQQPNTAVTPTDQSAQPQQDDKLSGYEDYLKLFEKTLGPAPELDKKKRNQLAMVAGINALGQALKQVVDYTGRVKHGAPINPQDDRLTPALLGQYEKELQDYQQRKDRYDLLKTNTMQNALQYAYGDEKAREQYEKQLDLLNKQQGFSQAQNEDEQKFRAEENEKERQARAAIYGEQAKADAAKLKQNYEYDKDLIWQRYAAEKALMDQKLGKDISDKLTGTVKVAFDNVGVVDQTTGKQLYFPAELVPDVAMKIAMNPTDELTRSMLESLGPEPEQNKVILYQLIAGQWKKYYDPVYDSTGAHVGFRMKGEAGSAPKEYKTFWDSPGMVTPDVQDAIPEWFK